MTQRKSWKVGIQYLLPQHALSRIVHWATRLKLGPLTHFAIRRFVRAFNVNLAEAVRSDAGQYASFNDFFTRSLREEVRPLDSNASVFVSPVDGAISQIGKIDNGQIFQAKGHSYTAAELLGNAEDARRYQHGSFATLYLSPRDYHRIHMPIEGELVSMRHVPGKLFSVNTLTAAQVPGLFARNERVVCEFQTVAGRVAMVMVGAIFVGSIETVWAGEITPPKGDVIRAWHYGGAGRPTRISLARGAEMGRFNMGSTVILLTEAGRVKWNEEFREGSSVQMGAALGRL